ncbi:hypothetical protein AB0L82_43300 [Nocardia sp. NPDC052001]|uniref:hypothetical protein n=1 Tax=Nocardia sp. NPDC052001 TaxID=3154853 RepID=UPI00343846F1
MGFSVVVPALNIPAKVGIDMQATRRHAEQARDTWVDWFLVNGSTTRGDLLSSAERAAVLDLWVDVIGPDKLLACAWEPEDLTAAALRHVTPMAVMRGIRTDTEALAFLSGLPSGSTVYSHPMFGLPFSPDIARGAAALGCLPAGGKLAKVKIPQIGEIRQVAPGFALWDGSARHIRESLTAGAAGFVGTPLVSLLGKGLPPKEVGKLQFALHQEQSRLDELPGRPERSAYLLAQVKKSL